jgi:hypothetical protein
VGRRDHRSIIYHDGWVSRRAGSRARARARARGGGGARGGMYVRYERTPATCIAAACSALPLNLRCHARQAAGAAAGAVARRGAASGCVPCLLGSRGRLGDRTLTPQHPHRLRAPSEALTRRVQLPRPPFRALRAGLCAAKLSRSETASSSSAATGSALPAPRRGRRRLSAHVCTRRLRADATARVSPFARWSRS